MTAGSVQCTGAEDSGAAISKAACPSTGAVEDEADVEVKIDVEVDTSHTPLSYAWLGMDTPKETTLLSSTTLPDPCLESTVKELP